MPSRIPQIARSLDATMSFLGDPEFELMLDQPDVANFAVGNPQEMPMPDLVAAYRDALEPKDKNWFAYKMSEEPSRRVIAEHAGAHRGLSISPDDVFVTNGGFAAIAVTLRALSGPGDEVVFVSPPWFFYEALISAAGAEPVRVTLTPPAFDLDAGAIAAAITERTAAVLINTPHNPTGRVYPPEQLAALAEVLADASSRHGRPIYLLSDEPYHRILFDGRTFTSPAAVYPGTVILYSYGKTLLAPGMRIGFIAFAPGLPGAGELRELVRTAQVLNGWSFANADLQVALPRLEQLSIGVAALQRRRDRLVPALLEMGYDTYLPEGTFYTMVRSPLADDREFERILRRHRVLVLPGSIVEVPGWFRISLTANDEMVENGIRGFRAALAEVGVPA